MKDVIKKEIYDYIKGQNLSNEEIKELDSYINDLINYIEPLLEINNLLKDKEKSKQIADMILDNLGEKIG